MYKVSYQLCIRSDISYIRSTSQSYIKSHISNILCHISARYQSCIRSDISFVSGQILVLYQFRYQYFIRSVIRRVSGHLPSTYQVSFDNPIRSSMNHVLKQDSRIIDCLKFSSIMSQLFLTALCIIDLCERFSECSFEILIGY